MNTVCLQHFLTAEGKSVYEVYVADENGEIFRNADEIFMSLKSACECATKFSIRYLTLADGKSK